MDALTHALEALVSKRANYLSHILAVAAAKDIIHYLPQVHKDGSNIEYREMMLNASMTAGLAFTNVSLGIVHSMAHTIGSFFGIAHGLADAVLLPYVIAFNRIDESARNTYQAFAEEIGSTDIVAVIKELNRSLGIAASFGEIIKNQEEYIVKLDTMVEMAQKDGCTKTNPVIPSKDQFKSLFMKAYRGE